MVENNFEGNVPERHIDEKLSTIASGTIKNYDRDMEDFQFHHALQHIFFLVNESNRYINENKLWEIKDKQKLGGFLYELLESLRITSILLYPFMPQTSEKMMAQLGLNADFSSKELEWGVLSPQKKINRGEVLFKKIK